MLQRLPEFFLNERRPFSITIADTLPDFHLEDSQHVSTSCQDVKVPAGVPVLQIQCITVKFQFRRFLDTINADAKDTSSEPMDISFEGILDGHEPHDDHLLYNEPDYTQLHTTAEARQPIQTTELGLSDAFEYEDSYLFEDGEAMLDHSFADNFSPFESQESGQTDLTTPDDDLTDASCLQTRTTEAVTSLLTDVAMRTLIGGEQSKPTESIRLLRPLPRHTLAVLIPLMFSPNFSSVGFSCSSYEVPCLILLGHASKISFCAHHYERHCLRRYGRSITRLEVQARRAEEESPQLHDPFSGRCRAIECL